MPVVELGLAFGLIEFRSINVESFCSRRKKCNLGASIGLKPAGQEAQDWVEVRRAIQYAHELLQDLRKFCKMRNKQLLKVLAKHGLRSSRARGLYSHIVLYSQTPEFEVQTLSETHSITVLIARPVLTRIGDLKQNAL